jgi:U3 small nucleolar RNA-associated protein 24
MVKNKQKTKKFAQTKRILNPKEAKQRKEQNEQGGQVRKQNKNVFKRAEHEMKIKRVEQITSDMFGENNSAIRPPYSVLIDTNFINFSIKNKIDIVKGMMDCLYANCVPHVTDCVIGELEKLGTKYRVALRVAKDPRFVRLPCMHKGRTRMTVSSIGVGNIGVTSSLRAIRI